MSPPATAQCVVLALVLVLIVIAIVAMWPRHSAKKSRFHPVQVSPCGPPYGRGDGYGTDVTGRNAAGTTVWPASAYSRVAPDPSGVAESFTGSDARRRQRREQFASLAGIEDWPAADRPYGNDAATVVAGLTRVRASGYRGGSLSPIAFAGDVDSDFEPSTEYGAEALKEGLTSDRRVEQNTLIASKTGLGSTRIDPRFEPGPNAMYPGANGSALYADGANAGGPTTGALTPTIFPATGTMISGRVFGFGSDVPWAQPPPEAITTEESRWTTH